MAESGSAAGITGPVLLGVVPHQPAIVLRRAADLALSAGVELVCAYVDVASYPVPGDAAGAAQPIDPDGVDDDAGPIAEGIRSRIAAELGGLPLAWRFVTLAGQPARALAHHADAIDAAMIVVGTHEGRLGARLEELLASSVAVHLTHRQGRPVLVVPLSPAMLPHHDG
ncbi:universal stress protein [Arthrobacter sp. CJ23]|uniref:universal stress protein n=1 Tax=Arthrobacter sp. CJ23 TaxID=2972479 RepID=UPI00215BC4C8|nr:universal stress protein [Arthrobacter sp. CJ23]UVJ38472.1 universal stress protein [Arthrobacter sp. CJ23]